jgi:hypothetical protein
MQSQFLHINSAKTFKPYYLSPAIGNMPGVSVLRWSLQLSGAFPSEGTVILEKATLLLEYSFLWAAGFHGLLLHW